MELIEGKVYTFKRLRGNKDANYAPQIIKKRMRLIKKYLHHAQFEDEFGIRISYRYFDITKMLNGEFTK